jgi:hypothetical protein
VGICVEVQTGVAVRLLIKRERHVERHVLASGRTPTVLLLGWGQTVAKRLILTKDAGLRRPVQGALLQTHRCAASLIPYMGGDSYVGHSTGSDLEQDLTHATCRSRLIHHTLDCSSVTFFSA